MQQTAHRDRSAPQPCAPWLQVARRFQRGDTDAWAELYQLWYDRIHRVAMRIVRCAQDAQDIVQNTFVRAWHARHKLREPAHLQAWVVRIATNLALSQHQKRNRYTTSPLGEEPACDATAHQNLEDEESKQTLRQAIDTLSPRQHDVIVLRIHQELTFKEIAHQLGCTDVSARVNYLYGVRKLQCTIAA